MNPRKSAFALIVCLALTLCFGSVAVFAQDAAKANPQQYKVAFENEKVRVLEYHSHPGGGICGVGVHSHPAHLTILLTDAAVKVTLPDGKIVTENGKAGDMFWSPAETHQVENVGADAHCYIVELKDKDWKPSTGLAK